MKKCQQTCKTHDGTVYTIGKAIKAKVSIQKLSCNTQAENEWINKWMNKMINSKTQHTHKSLKNYVNEYKNII